MAFSSHYWKINLCLPSNLQLSEKDKPYVDIQGLTASTMEILLDFVYTETVHVTVENVQELLPAACLLQLKGNCQVPAQIAQLLLFRDLVCLTFCKRKTCCGRHDIYKYLCQISVVLCTVVSLVEELPWVEKKVIKQVIVPCFGLLYFCVRIPRRNCGLYSP